MRIVYIHGAPATGKLTIARELVQRTSARLLDNHSTIDLARNVFDFGAPGFWELVNSLRLTVLNTAGQNHIPLIAMTSCYSEPQDNPIVEQYEALVETHGGGILPVYLFCSEEEMLRRIGNPDRENRRKISSPDGLKSFLKKHNFVPLKRENCIEIDTETVSSVDAASRILQRFRLS